MDAVKVIADEKKYVAGTYTRPEVVFTHGEGAYVFDADGKKYLDMTAGIAVVSIGHSDPEWVAAVSEQAGQLVHVSNLYHTAPAVELAGKLVESSFADKVYFGNSGAEANEGAIKFARKFHYMQGTQRAKLVYFSGAFHGRTMGALAVTPREKYQKPFKPLMPEAVGGVFNDVSSAEALIDDETCAVIVEPVQGEGGIVPATAAFLGRLRELCDEHDAILIFDEVQCGVGRTGYLYGYEACGVAPDILTMAKPLANGLPIGATLLNEKVAECVRPGDHASTFAGGAMVCRGANVVFDRISDPDFLAHVRNMGEVLHDQLESKLPKDKVVEIRGRGLMVGVELTESLADLSLVPKALERGMLIVGAGANVIRLVPPLIVDEQQITEAVDILADILVG